MQGMGSGVDGQIPDDIDGFVSIRPLGLDLLHWPMCKFLGWTPGGRHGQATATSWRFTGQKRPGQRPCFRENDDVDSCSCGSFDLSALMPEQAMASEGKMFHNYWVCKMPDPFPNPISHPKASRDMSLRRSCILTLDRAVVESEFAV